MKIIVVEVTELDLAHGQPADCEFCPLARALLRATGLPWEVYPDGLTALPPAGRPLAVTMPRCAREFVRSFDAGEAVRPFSFALELPEGVVA